MIREPSIPADDLLEVWRLLKAVARARRRLALEAQRQRLIRSIVANDMRRRGLNGLHRLVLGGDNVIDVDHVVVAGAAV